jgi:hypothetical protein
MGAARLVLAAARLTHRAEHNQPPVLDIILVLFSYTCYASRLNFRPQETASVSTDNADPTAASAKPPYTIPPQDLRDMVLTLPRPPAGAPEAAWLEVVQGGLDRLGVLDPRDALQTMLAVTVIATHAGAVDACRLAFAPDASAVQALRQRASATALARVMAGALRWLKQLRPQPAAPARGGKAAAEEPAAIIRWIDKIDDAEMNEEIERLQREAAGESPLPVKPGPRRIYKYTPDDYALTWVPDERAARKYPGWENMTKTERQEFFGYTYTGPVAPLEMLTPASRAAAAAGEE